MSTSALIIGNSDGIGLGLTRRLLASGWNVAGISRSDSPIDTSSYVHRVTDVTSEGYDNLLRDVVIATAPDLCVYAAGIGELLDPTDMGGEAYIVDVNLIGMIRTVAQVVPGMVQRGSGHIIGLSSVADDLLSAEAPSYHASKAGFSNYLGGLQIALRGRGVHVTNVRFGFVDTKMAKGSVRPFMMSVEKAVDHIVRCMEKRPAVHTAPRITIPFIKFRKTMMRLARRVPAVRIPAVN